MAISKKYARGKYRFFTQSTILPSFVTYNDIYGNINKQLTIVNIYANILRQREILLSAYDSPFNEHCDDSNLSLHPCMKGPLSAPEEEESVPGISV